jgi:hypothetical protein
MTPDDFVDFGDEINRMFIGNNKPLPDNGLVLVYWETLQDLSWDEFRAGIFNARQNAAKGFVPGEGVIREEAIKARRFLQGQREKQYNAGKLEPMPVNNPPPKDRVPNTIAEQVVAYEKAAEMAKANHNQALKEWQRTPPGDPALEDIMERRIKYRANYWHFLRLRDQYQEMLDHGETESTIATEAKALDRRAKQAREQGGQR